VRAIWPERPYPRPEWESARSWSRSVGRPTKARLHERESIPHGNVSCGRNRRAHRWKKPAKSRLQPGLAAPQKRVHTSVNAARRSAAPRVWITAEFHQRFCRSPVCHPGLVVPLASNLYYEWF
jgi:hypothetical protein